MHILTGMIITALLRRRSQARSASGTGMPPLRTGPIRVVHALPGRIRLRVPRLVGDAGRQAQLAKRLVAIDGVDSVETGAATGSVLVRFDDSHLRPDLLVAAVARLLDLESELRRTPTPLVARELRGISSSVNRAVLEQTRGLVDLRTVTMLVLGVIGVRKLVSEGLGSLPAGVTLLWWASNSLLGRQSDAKV